MVLTVLRLIDSLLLHMNLKYYKWPLNWDFLVFQFGRSLAPSRNIVSGLDDDVAAGLGNYITISRVLVMTL